MRCQTPRAALASANEPISQPARVLASSLKIALVSTQSQWHGGEEQAALLLDGLERRGHTCHILARQSSEFAARLCDRGARVFTFAGRGQSPSALWSIRQHLKSIRPDVLYFNDPHALTAAGLASWGLGIPLRVAARRVDFPLKFVRRYRLLSDVIICVSRAVARICLDAGLPPDAVAIVHDGVDPRRMELGNRQRGRLALSVDETTCVAMTIAKLTDHKGHQYFLRALPGVLREVPSLRWVVVGDGPLRQELEQLARQLGVERNVQFLGYRHDVPDLLAAAELLVFPSHMEGLCSSIVDAMLAQRPIVATTAGGIPDLLDRRNNTEPAVAWLTPPRDPAALTKAVLDLFKFPNLTAHRVALADLRARTEFVADQMVEQTLAVFQARLIAKNVARPEVASSENTVARSTAGRQAA